MPLLRRGRVGRGGWGLERGPISTFGGASDQCFVDVPSEDPAVSAPIHFAVVVVQVSHFAVVVVQVSLSHNLLLTSLMEAARFFLGVS